MVPAASPAPAPDALPETLRPWFWDCDFDRLTWQEHRDFVVRRVLSLGSWNAVCDIRTRLGDAALRRWIEEHQGRWLSSRQLRFWQVVLDLSPEFVDTCLASPGRKIWEGRTRR